MVQKAADVQEAEATGKLKDIFDDIKRTFGVPSVGGVFRVLAVNTDYMQIAWRILKPNTQTVFFEDAANVMRSRSLEGIRDLGLRASAAADANVRPLIDALHYGVAKQFLAASALRSATNGLQPKLAELPMSEKRQVVPSTQPAAPIVDETAPILIDPSLLRSISETFAQAGLTVVDQEFLALGRWPNLLESVMAAWTQISQHRNYAAIRRTIVQAADDVAGAFPFRMDLHPHALRHAGLSEQEIDSVRATLNSYHRGLPLALLTAAHLTESVHVRA